MFSWNTAVKYNSNYIGTFFNIFLIDFKILAEHLYQVHETPVKNHWSIGNNMRRFSVHRILYNIIAIILFRIAFNFFYLSQQHIRSA